MGLSFTVSLLLPTVTTASPRVTVPSAATVQVVTLETTPVFDMVKITSLVSS